MSLETEIKKLTAALEANTAAHLGSPVAAVVPPPVAAVVPPPVAAVVPPAPVAAVVPPAPVAAVVPPAPATTTAVTAEQVNAIAGAKAQQMADGGAAVMAVLRDQFGVTGISLVPAANLPLLVTAINALGA